LDESPIEVTAHALIGRHRKYLLSADRQMSWMANDKLLGISQGLSVGSKTALSSPHEEKQGTCWHHTTPDPRYPSCHPIRIARAPNIIAISSIPFMSFVSARICVKSEPTDSNGTLAMTGFNYTVTG
jgi:hypothetical protein